MNTKKDQRWAIPPGPSPEAATPAERGTRDTDPAASRRRARTDPERPDLVELAHQVAPSAVQARADQPQADQPQADQPQADQPRASEPPVAAASMQSFTGASFGGQTIPAEGPEAEARFSAAPLEPGRRVLGFFQSGGLSSPSREAVTAPPEASPTLASPALSVPALSSPALSSPALSHAALSHPAPSHPALSSPAAPAQETESSPRATLIDLVPAGASAEGDEEGRPTIVERSRPTSPSAGDGGETLPSPPWGEGED